VSQVSIYSVGSSVPWCSLPLRSGQIGGGARMGATEKEGVVGMDHRLHDTDNVYIADASVFPTSLGVDTDLTVMAFSHLVANAVAANLG
jgi:choline dehydrogenase-like flavoprotein